MNWITIGSGLLALAVIIGAFGAHGLKETLGENISVYETGVFYHFIHALGILLVTLIGAQSLIEPQIATRVCILLACGIIIFSGSLYALSITNIKWLGAVTPIGGTLFIIAWCYLAWSATR